MRWWAHYTLWLALLAGPATAQTSPEAVAPDGGAPGSPAWLEKNQGVGAAASAPLDDLNLRRLEIPPILILAAQDPYSLDGLNTCKDLSREINGLNAVLGPDFDAQTVADSRTLVEKGEAMAGQQAVSVVRDATTSLIPLRGLVRKVSGAERHAREVDVAIEAGQTRRAYLKGVGMTKNCAPPSAPAWFTPKETAAAKQKRR